MRKLSFGLVSCALLALSACVVAPPYRGAVVVRAERPVPSQLDVEQLDYVGNATPLMVLGYNYPFYPRYFSDCNCVFNVAFVGGYWINHHGVRIVPPRKWQHPPPQVRKHFHGEIQKNPHHFKRWHPPARTK